MVEMYYLSANHPLYLVWNPAKIPSCFRSRDEVKIAFTHVADESMNSILPAEAPGEITQYVPMPNARDLRTKGSGAHRLKQSGVL